MKKSKKIIRNIIIAIIFIYVVFIFVNQQKTLNEYTKSTEELSQQIEDEKQNKEELSKKKDDVNSNEFIEEMAREKLDKYYTNKKLYVDQGK